jgi:hypothetical protein
MDNFVPDIDRGAVNGERSFHSVDRPHHAGTKAAWRAKHDFQVWFGGHRSDPGTESPLADGQGPVKSINELGPLAIRVKTD